MNERDIGIGHGGGMKDRLTHMHRHLFRRGPIPRRHFHLFAFHRHPDWHGHCHQPRFDAAATATRHLMRGHGGEALLCPVCVAVENERPIGHSCDGLHFHGPFRHRHTETGR